MFAFDSKRYPTKPGCYLMRDAKGKVIYVGKAKNLRRRLASYFQPHRKRWRLERLVSRIADIEIIIVNNETEALVLENNLIKQHKPRYNRMLVDDRTGYCYIVLTAERWPRLLPFKKHRANRELEHVEGQAIVQRFGPYPSRRYRDKLLEFVVENYRIRTCEKLPRRACLLYHLGRCSAPCESLISESEYSRAVAEARTFLSHPQVELVRHMKSQMLQYAQALEFERAQRIKVQVEALETMLAQQVVERDVEHDQDVLYFGEGRALVMRIRQGALKGLALVGGTVNREVDHWREDLMLSLYSSQCPSELIVNELAQPERMTRALTSANGHAVRVSVPRDGEECELLKLAEQNYAYRVGLVPNAPL